MGGPPFTAVTDHKPLVPIFNGNRHGSTRTEQIKLRLQGFKLTYFMNQGLPIQQITSHVIQQGQSMNARKKKKSKDIQRTIFMLIAPKHKEDAVTLRQIGEDT